MVEEITEVNVFKEQEKKRSCYVEVSNLTVAEELHLQYLAQNKEKILASVRALDDRLSNIDMPFTEEEITIMVSEVRKIAYAKSIGD